MVDWCALYHTLTLTDLEDRRVGLLTLFREYLFFLHVARCTVIMVVVSGAVLVRYWWQCAWHGIEVEAERKIKKELLQEWKRMLLLSRTTLDHKVTSVEGRTVVVNPALNHLKLQQL